MSEALFMDGTGITPGSEGCRCTLDCEWPCWQRIGLTDEPCCPDCAELSALDDGPHRAATAGSSGGAESVSPTADVPAGRDANTSPMPSDPPPGFAISERDRERRSE